MSPNRTMIGHFEKNYIFVLQENCAAIGGNKSAIKFNVNVVSKSPIYTQINFTRRLNRKLQFLFLRTNSCTIVKRARCPFIWRLIKRCLKK